MTAIHHMTLADSPLRDPPPEPAVAPDRVRLTADEVKAHRAYYGQNATYAGVASDLGISENSARQLVRSAAAKLALGAEREPDPIAAAEPAEERETTMPPVKEATSKQAREWTPEEDTRLLEMRERLTQREIAEQLGRTTATVGWRISLLRRRGELPAPVQPPVSVQPAESAPPPPAAARAPEPESELPPKAAVDPEIRLLAGIYNQLAGLDQRARGRILGWLTDRFNEPEVDL